MNRQDAANPTAWLSPWLPVRNGSAQVLFGFCLRHVELGGGSWLRSSAILELDEAGSRARTASGRVYVIKHKISLCDLPDDEARLSFALLVGPASHEQAPVDADVRQWLRALKVGRRLRLPVPDRRDTPAVATFLLDNQQAYLARGPGPGPGPPVRWR